MANTNIKKAIVTSAASILAASLYSASAYAATNKGILKLLSLTTWVNGAIIFSVFFIVFKVFGLDKNFNSGEGKVGSNALAIIFSVITALIISDSYPGKFIWGLSGQGLIGYFYGDFGIISPKNPQNAAIFAVLLILGKYFLNNILPDSSDQKVHWWLAFLAALIATHGGTTLQTAVIVAELILWVVFARTVFKFSEKWLLNFFISFIVVGYISYKITYGTSYQGFLGGIVGFFLGGGTWLTVIGMVFLIIACTILVKIRKGEDRVGKYKGRNSVRFMNTLSGLSRATWAKFPGLHSFLVKLRDHEGREKTIIYRNRLLFMLLLDKELRYNIWVKKFSMLFGILKDIEPGCNALGRFKYGYQTKEMIVFLRSQKGRIEINDGTVSSIVGESPHLAPIFDDFKGYIGWNYANKLLVAYMNHLNNFFEKRYKDIERETNADKKEELINNFGTECLKKTNEMKLIDNKFNTSSQTYKKLVGDYHIHHSIKAYELNIFDMLNVSGNAKHTYKFAKKGSYYRQGTVTSNINNDETEVNIYGEFMEDVRANSWPRRRLLNPNRDTIPFPPSIDMRGILSFYIRDWTEFIKDMQYGKYHQLSRNVSEYIEAWNSGIWEEEKMNWPPRGGTVSSPAFDLRVLANPGLGDTWSGTRNIRDIEGIEGENKEPHISLNGLKRFLKVLIERTVLKAKENKEFVASCYTNIEHEEKSTPQDEDSSQKTRQSGNSDKEAA